MVELNRSRHHKNLFSVATKNISKKEQHQILDWHYEPYRRSVENAIATFAAKKHSVLHLSVHSFTPEMDGEVRTADIGLLYDPQRTREKQFCARWKAILEETNSEIRVRNNYPYRGTADGFTTYLRKQFPDENYAGIELEVNQKFPLGNAEQWEKLQQTIVETFNKAVK